MLGWLVHKQSFLALGLAASGEHSQESEVLAFILSKV
jgi:hypothetical protein